MTGNALLRPLLLLMVILPVVLAGSEAVAARRLALVLGNNQYESLAVLKKADNDARAVAEALRSIGFQQVFEGVNLNRRSMNLLISELVDSVQPSDVVFFFYAGHGVAIQGANYLLPTDMPDEGNEALMTAEAIAADSVVSAIQARGAKTVVMVLDACRDNPFATAGKRSVGSKRGVGGEIGGSDVFVLYSAGFNQTALDALRQDDPDPNSVFTRAFVPLLKKNGLSAQRLAKQLQREVRSLALSVGHDQRPAYYDQLDGDLFLNGEPAPDTEAMGKDRLNQQSANAPQTECDRQVKDIKALQREAATFNFMKDRRAFHKVKAEIACLSAVEAYPNEPRLRYRYGWALHEAGKHETAQVELVKAADQGSIDAKLGLAMMYLDGNGLPANFAKASMLVADDAARGNVEAMLLLSMMNMQEPSPDPEFKPDRQKALEYLAKATSLGNATAMLFAGVFARGEGDMKNAVGWWQKAVESGDSDPRIYDFIDSAFDHGESALYGEVVAWYHSRADSNDAIAMRLLAKALSEGTGAKKNVAEAIKWLERSAELGETLALVSLAEIRLADGPQRDADEALRLYLLAGEQGEPWGFYGAGEIFVEGKGVPVDLDRAVAIYEGCAANKNAHCMGFLADLYLEDGRLRDPKKAAAWLVKAADLKDASSARKLASLYDDDGPLKDETELARWNAVAEELEAQ